MSDGVCYDGGMCVSNGVCYVGMWLYVDYGGICYIDGELLI